MCVLVNLLHYTLTFHSLPTLQPHLTQACAGTVLRADYYGCLLRRIREPHHRIR